MALTTAKDVYRAAFEPLPGSVYHTAYPYCYRAPGGAHSPDACTCDWEAQLDLTFHQFIYPDQVAAIIVEPVLGEGGYIVPPPGFLPRLREITRQHGILLIADEVQTGFGRTGELFAVRHWDVEPDILVMAKGDRVGAAALRDPRPGRADGRLAAGRPRRHVRRQRRSPAPRPTRPSTSSRTRAWSRNARERGAQFLAGLRDAGRPVPGGRRRPRPRADGRRSSSSSPGEGDGRVPDPDLDEADPGRGARPRSLIVLTAGTYVNVIRIIPPLVTTADEVDLALSILDESLAAARA